MNPRRVFLMTLAASGGLLAASSASAQAAKVDPKEPQAAALNYVDDAAQAAARKLPKYAPGQVCSNCTLYQAKTAADPIGPCAVFGGRHVAAKGWCSAWVKKA